MGGGPAAGRTGETEDTDRWVSEGEELHADWEQQLGLELRVLTQQQAVTVIWMVFLPG